jgi:hypothetical protein
MAFKKKFRSVEYASLIAAFCVTEPNPDTDALTGTLLAMGRVTLYCPPPFVVVVVPCTEIVAPEIAAQLEAFLTRPLTVPCPPAESIGFW